VDVIILVGLISFLPFLLFFIFVFPQEFYELLLFFYNPDTRVTFLVGILFFYLWSKYRKKHKKHSYDYFDDLSSVEGRVDGKYYHYRHYIDAKKGANFTVFVDGKCGYDFMLKFENKFEKFLKKISLAYECQSGDKRFDETIYILSDDKILCQDLQEDDELRKLIFELFWSLKKENYIVKSLRYFDGRLILLGVKRGETDEDTYKEIEKLSQHSASLMFKIISHLPDKIKEDDYIHRERTSWAISVVLALFVALLSNGVIKLLLDSSTTFFLPRLVERYDFFMPSLIVTASFLLVYTLFSFFYFYKSSRLALALFLGFTIGASGVFLSSITGLKEMNIYLDNTKAKKRLERVLSTRYRSGRSAAWYVTFSRLDEIKVPHGFYKKFHKGDRALVEIKKGYLNMPWVYNIEKINKN